MSLSPGLVLRPDRRELAHLAGLAKMETLDLRGTKVTAQDIAALQKALPACKIAWEAK